MTFPNILSPRTITSLVLITLGINFVSATEPSGSPEDAGWIAVKGTGIHYFSSSLLHQSKDTPTGKIDNSTDLIELSGDLNGKVLYHVTSEYDFASGTLVNTGHQVFSGTVLGSEPVLLLDNQFTFRVDLNSGETRGEVMLSHRLDGQATQCNITVIGTGFDNEGNGLAEYYGYCSPVGRLKCTAN